MNAGLDSAAGVKRVMPDDKLRCTSPRVEPGGGGINVSRAIKRLGGESLAVYPQGGCNGEELHKLLQKEEIDSDPVPVEQSNRVNLTFSESESERQFRFVFPGPSLKKQEWQACLDKIKACQDEECIVVASGSLPPGVPGDFYRKVTEILQGSSARLVLDAHGEDLREAVDRPVFLIKPNIREFSQISGSDLQEEGQIESVARNFVQKSQITYLVISLGSGGALLVTEDDNQYFRSPTVPIKSKVGAGDSMVAGIILKLQQGEKVKTAVAYGVSAGAAAVTTPGSELCTREKTDELFKVIQNNGKGKE